MVHGEAEFFDRRTKPLDCARDCLCPRPAASRLKPQAGEDEFFGRRTPACRRQEATPKLIINDIFGIASPLLLSCDSKTQGFAKTVGRERTSPRPAYRRQAKNVRVRNDTKRESH